MSTNYGLPCDDYEEGCLEDEWNGISPLELDAEERGFYPVTMPSDLASECYVRDCDTPF
jgi:hypothetical protein